jgi:hypothetical protein
LRAAKCPGGGRDWRAAEQRQRDLSADEGVTWNDCNLNGMSQARGADDGGGASRTGEPLSRPSPHPRPPPRAKSPACDASGGERRCGPTKGRASLVRLILPEGRSTRRCDRGALRRCLAGRFSEARQAAKGRVHAVVGEGTGLRPATLAAAIKAAMDRRIEAPQRGDRGSRRTRDGAEREAALVVVADAAAAADRPGAGRFRRGGRSRGGRSSRSGRSSAGARRRGLRALASSRSRRRGSARPCARRSMPAAAWEGGAGDRSEAPSARRAQTRRGTRGGASRLGRGRMKMRVASGFTEDSRDSRK